MMRGWRMGLMVMAIAVGGRGSEILQNDDYTSGPVLAYPVGLFDGIGAKFTPPPESYPFRLDAIQFYHAGNDENIFAVDVFSDNSATASPGPNIGHPGSYSVAETGLIEFDLTASSPSIIICTGAFRVVLYPAFFDSLIGLDNSGINPLRNTYLDDPSPQWQFLENRGAGGDVIMRARITSLRPALRITLATNAVVLRWPNPSSGFALQETEILSTNGPSLWSNITQTPVVNGTNKEVSQSLTGASRYYRLELQQCP